MVLAINLDSYFAARSPRSPVAETGQIHATHLHHGALVYLTSGQLFWMNALVPITGLLFVLGATAYYRSKKD
ncbi:hypothetical protein [Bradyrhizobium ganzhouense]|uniref:hypothetical protein n=1 Tax=Bradyrhizobium ganzhouense TaxID=1179767 RepID=UPI003CEB4389